MDLDIEEFANYERDMVINASANYGEEYYNTRDLILMTFDFLSGKVDINAYLFIAFISQTRKSLLLSLLSTVRKHDVQAGIMLRHALESSVLACYALCHNSSDKFIINEEDNVSTRNKAIKQEAYRWIDKAYSKHSGEIKQAKDLINDYFSHASVHHIINNYDFSGDRIKFTLIDETDDRTIRQRLWWIGNITLLLLELFFLVIKDYPYLKIKEGVFSEYGKLHDKNQQIKETQIKEFGINIA